MKNIAVLFTLVGICCAFELVVVEHAITDTVIPVGPKPDNFGDGLVFANPIFDSSDTYQVGTDQGNCIRTVVGAAWECRWTTTFSEGQIMVEGPFYDDQNSTVAITGGTGLFKGASGQMILGHRDPSGKEYDFKFFLD